jgi:hypothetical protein
MEMSLPSVLIESPKFTGTKSSVVVCVLNKSERPIVPGISETKYSVFSSGLKIGWLYCNYQGSSVIFTHLSFLNWLYIFSLTYGYSRLFLSSVEIVVSCEIDGLPSLVKTGVDSLNLELIDLSNLAGFLNSFLHLHLPHNFVKGCGPSMSVY